MSAFNELRSIRPQLLADGYLARAVHGQQLTLAVVEVEPGAVLPEHQHANEQSGMVIKGSVVFRVATRRRRWRRAGPGGYPPEHRTPLPAEPKAPSWSTSSHRRETTGLHANRWTLVLLNGHKHPAANRDPSRGQASCPLSQCARMSRDGMSPRRIWEWFSAPFRDARAAM